MPTDLRMEFRGCGHASCLGQLNNLTVVSHGPTAVFPCHLPGTALIRVGNRNQFGFGQFRVDPSMVFSERTYSHHSNFDLIHVL